MNRRQFYRYAAGAAGAAALASVSHAEENAPAKRIRRPLCVSSYSYWGYRTEAAPTMEQCVIWASEMGFVGLEILEKQMYLNPAAGEITESKLPGGGQLFQTYRTNRAYLKNLKRFAFTQGIALCGYATHQSFVTPDEEFRQKNVDATIAGIETAGELGIPTLRVNTGRWGTSKDFTDLMNHKGIEPPLEGYTDADALPWVIESLEKCLPTAEKCGVILGLENHWGLARRAEGAVEIVKKIDSPWLRLTLDTGNLLDDDRYEQMAQMAPYATFVHAKSYYGGGTWYTLEMDYPRIMKILDEANYRGFISCEYEGRESPATGVPKAKKELEDAMQEI